MFQIVDLIWFKLHRNVFLTVEYNSSFFFLGTIFLVSVQMRKLSSVSFSPCSLAISLPPTSLLFFSLVLSDSVSLSLSLLPYVPSLSIYLSVYVCLCACLYVCLCLFVCPIVCPIVCVCVCVFLSVSVSVSVYVCVCVCVCESVKPTSTLQSIKNNWCTAKCSG